MKPKLHVLLLFLLLSGSIFCQPPCAQDSCTDHTPITVEMDTIAPPCYPFGCNPIPDSCHVVALIDSFSGVFELSNADERFEIIVLDRCRWVVFDTCATVFATTPGFVLFRTFPPTSTVLICGDGDSDIQVTVKHTPSANFPPFGPPIYDIDTLCGPFVGIDGPIVQFKQYDYFDPYNFQKVSELKPNMYYIKREKSE